MKVIRTNDGGYALNGETMPGPLGQADFLTVRMDGNNKTLWAKCYGSSGTDVGSDLAQTPDGGFILTGGTASFQPSTFQTYIIRIDASGNVLWSKVFQAGFYDSWSKVLKASDGNYFIIANSNSGPSTILKIDINGNLIWSRFYKDINRNFVCSLLSGGDIVLIADGYFLISRIGQNGTVKWSKYFDNGAFYLHANSVTEDAGGNLIVSGVSSNHSSNVDNGMLMKLSPDASLFWAKYCGGSAYDELLSSYVTGSGAIIACGYSSSYNNGTRSGYLLNFDGTGKLSWSQIVGFGGVQLQNIFPAEDGGYVCMGSTFTSTNSGQDFAILKFRSDGTTCNYSQGVTSTTSDFFPVVSENPASDSVISGVLTSVNTNAADANLRENTICTH